MIDKYYRILLHKEKDAKLYEWLEQERVAGERPGSAIKRKLYKLKKKGNQK